MQRLREHHQPVIYIGDGLSDRFAVPEASLVLAKGKLLDYCGTHGVSCEPFETFGNVRMVVEKLLSDPVQSVEAAVRERRLQARREKTEVAT